MGSAQGKYHIFGIRNVEVEAGSAMELVVEGLTSPKGEQQEYSIDSPIEVFIAQPVGGLTRCWLYAYYGDGLSAWAEMLEFDPLTSQEERDRQVEEAKERLEKRRAEGWERMSKRKAWRWPSPGAVTAR